MNKPRLPKKSETFELRLAHPTKTALMDKARAEGRAASEVVRDTIETYIADAAPEAPSRSRLSLRRFLGVLALAPVLIGSVLIAANLSAPAAAQPELKQAFALLDTDQDRQLSRIEFLSPQRAHQVEIRAVETAFGGELAVGATNPPGAFVRYVLRGTADDVPLLIAVSAPEGGDAAAQLETLVGEAFDRLDADSNGTLSESEFANR